MTSCSAPNARVQRRLAIIALAMGLSVAGCTDAAGEAAPVQSETASLTDTTAVPEPSELALGEATDFDGVRVYAEVPALDEGADAGGSAPTPTESTTNRVDATPRPSVGAPTPAEGGSTAGYTGVLGNFAVDQVLSTSPIPAPVAAPGTAPLTGLPGGSSTPAVIVKIDNSSSARPQAGLNSADVVIEEEVEWGITRLAAIFHTNQTTVGPVRSARSTDISFLSSLGQPAFVYSGANDVFDALILNQAAVRNYSAARNGGYWRQSGRRAPSNLFADTNSFVGSGAQPPAWFAFRGAGESSPGQATSQVNVSWANTRVTWNWDGSSWQRTQNGSAHLTSDGDQASAANIVVAETAVVDTGLQDSAGGFVPEYVFAGSGPVTVFTDGKRIDGTWYRPTLGDPAILVAADGTPIELTPGRTWVEVIAPGLMTSS